MSELEGLYHLKLVTYNACVRYSILSDLNTFQNKKLIKLFIYVYHKGVDPTILMLVIQACCGARLTATKLFAVYPKNLQHIT